MKKMLRLIIGAVLLLGVVEQAQAGSSNRIGTAGAQELRIPVSARSVALGGANIADATGTEAFYLNPAGAALTEGTEVMFTHLDYIAGMAVNYAAVVSNFGRFGNLGLSGKVLDIGDIEETTVDQPEGTGQVFSPTFSVFAVHYARQMTDRVIVGGSIQYVNERVLRETATGLAFDLGFQYIAQWRGLQLGLVIKNLGPAMRFDGPDFGLNLRPPDQDPQSTNRTLRTQSASFELPSSMNLSAVMDLWDRNQHRVTTMAVFQSNNFSEDEYRVGSEYSFRDHYFLRAGFVTNSQEIRSWWGRNISKPDVQQEGQYLFGGALGAGLVVNLGTATRLYLDYTYMLAQDFFNPQFLTLKVAF